MEEIFLDMTLPGFNEAEKSILAQGYIEKRYTKSTQKEIEDAYKRQLLKQLVTTDMKPSNINALKPQINQMVKTTLYENGPNGSKVFKFKMFVPSKKLREQREAAQMQENIEEEEVFVHENYGKYLSKVEKAEKAILNTYSNVKNITPNNSSNKIQKAVDKSRAVNKLTSELLPQIAEIGDPSLLSRVQIASIRAQQLLAHSEAIKDKWSQPYEELIGLMSKTPIKLKSGINNEFIENIMDLNNDNNDNNNNNDNNRNTNKFFGKAMSADITSADVKFLRDIMKIFTSRGMSKSQAVELGVILGNLPRDELEMIMNQIKPVMGKSNDEIAQQLYSYLISKKSGGRKTRRQTHRATKTHKRKTHKTRRHYRK